MKIPNYEDTSNFRILTIWNCLENQIDLFFLNWHTSADLADFLLISWTYHAYERKALFSGINYL